MAKHLANQEENTIVRQGVRLVYLENRVKELEKQLIQERADRIENLQTIRHAAEADTNYTLKTIADYTAETLETISNGIIKIKKENSLDTDQDK